MKKPFNLVLMVTVPLIISIILFLTPYFIVAYKYQVKQERQISESRRLTMLSKAYEHRSKLYADSALYYYGRDASSRMQFWVRNAISDDSLKQIYIDSARVALFK